MNTPTVSSNQSRSLSMNSPEATITRYTMPVKEPSGTIPTPAISKPFTSRQNGRWTTLIRLPPTVAELHTPQDQHRQRLCELCQKLDLSLAFELGQRSHSQWGEIVAVRELPDLLLEQDMVCPLCLLFHGARYDGDTGHPTRPYDIVAMQFARAVTGEDRAQDCCAPSERDEVCLVVLPWRVNRTQDHSHPFSTPQRLARARVKKIVRQMPSEGWPKVPEHIDWTRINRFMQQCKASHGVSCGTVARFDCDANDVKVLRNTNFIECNTRKIVSYHPGLRYTALSYVWGVSTSESMNEWRMAVGGPLPNHLAPLIEDAIKVSLAMGHNYLWVDRYCIDQQDEVQKLAHIEIMNQIYSLAELTIIDAAGTNETRGLSGVSVPRVRPQDTYLSLGRQTLRLAPCTPFHDIQVSKWASRGWTYQESALSQRRLVFTRDEVYFECNGLCRLESLPRRFTDALKGFLNPRYKNVSVSQLAQKLRSIEGIVSYDDWRSIERTTSLGDLSRFLHIRPLVSYAGPSAERTAEPEEKQLDEDGHVGSLPRISVHVRCREGLEQALQKHEAEWLSMAEEPTRHSIWYHISLYNTRVLKYETDRLKAFKGMLNSVGSNFFGLPVIHAVGEKRKTSNSLIDIQDVECRLLMTLPWISVLTCNKLKVDLTRCGAQRVGHPSFSWTGWAWEGKLEPFDMKSSVLEIIRRDRSRAQVENMDDMSFSSHQSNTNCRLAPTNSDSPWHHFRTNAEEGGIMDGTAKLLISGYFEELSLALSGGPPGSSDIIVRLPGPHSGSVKEKARIYMTRIPHCNFGHYSISTACLWLYQSHDFTVGLLLEAMDWDDLDTRYARIGVIAVPRETNTQGTFRRATPESIWRDCVWRTVVII